MEKKKKTLLSVKRYFKISKYSLYETLTMVSEDIVDII